MRRARHNSGFTLMELILVLVVMVIVAMIAAPNLTGFGRGRALPNAAADLANIARWCAVMAKSDGVRYRLNLDVPQDKYWVTKDDGTTGTNYVEVAYDDRKEFKLPEGVSFGEVTIPTTEDGEVYITFEPAGRSPVASMILAVEESDAKLIVVCESGAGSFRVLDPKKEEFEPIASGGVR